jgi:hypothetical protein
MIGMIEDNYIRSLSEFHNNKLKEQIKQHFIDYEEQRFIDTFYHHFWMCNYDRNKIMVDLDDVWKMMGFTQKINAKRILEKQFILGEDYNIKSPIICNHNKIKTRCKICHGCELCFHNIIKSSCYDCSVIEMQIQGGHNIKKYIMTKETFKCLCAKAGTIEGNKIYKCYTKLEKMIQDLNETQFIETNETIGMKGWYYDKNEGLKIMD